MKDLLRENQLKAPNEQSQQFVGDEILWNGIIEEQGTTHLYLAPKQLNEPANCMWKTGFKELQASRASTQSEFIRYRGKAATDFRTSVSDPGQQEPETAQSHWRLPGNHSAINPSSLHILPSFWAHFLPRALPVNTDISPVELQK